MLMSLIRDAYGPIDPHTLSLAPSLPDDPQELVRLAESIRRLAHRRLAHRALLAAISLPAIADTLTAARESIAPEGTPLPCNEVGEFADRLSHVIKYLRDAIALADRLRAALDQEGDPGP